MDKKIVITSILLIVAIGAFLFWRNGQYKTSIISPATDQSSSANNASSPAQPIAPEQNNISAFQPPLDRASERVTKKPFGIFITPKTSPVQPEKFRGYHTGNDFEIFSEELDADVSVHAVCSGKLLLKKYATGYGGLAVQLCELDNNSITVIYGHLKLASINLAIGNSLSTGDTIGILGKAFSSETSGERKHLHLGFHKGSSVNILGYVQSNKDLSNWIDPCLYVCEK